MQSPVDTFRAVPLREAVDSPKKSSPIPSQKPALPINERISLQRRAVVPDRSISVEKADRSLRGIDMNNINSFVYTASVNLGGGTFDLIPDTGSSDTWVSCANVGNIECRFICPWDAIHLSYGSGDTCIEVYVGPFGFGDIQIDEFHFGVAQGSTMHPSASGQKLLTDGTMGILGLAYPSIASIKASNYLINEYKSFSMYFTSGMDEEGSFMMINGVDQELIAERQLTPHVVPVKRTEHWTVGLTGFEVDGETIAPCSSTVDGACDAFIDSGTAVLSMPASVYASFADKFLVPNGCFVDYTVSEFFHVCPDSIELPTLKLTMGNTVFALPGDQYRLPLGNGQILAEVRHLDDYDKWIVGATFLQVYYADFIVNESVTFYCPDGMCTTVETSGSPQAVTPPASSSPSSVPKNPNAESGSSSSDTQASESSPDSSSSTGLIAALSVIGAVVLLALAVVFMRRRRKQKRQENEELVESGNYHAEADL